MIMMWCPQAELGLECLEYTVDQTHAAFVNLTSQNQPNKNHPHRAGQSELASWPALTLVNGPVFS